ncbi:MAG TPA: hypothetical protein VE152_02530, partial [Acidimicrobiales bacterium]|nr:hypothetical protein [Acidimicrobiales bacterium]
AASREALLAAAEQALSRALGSPARRGRVPRQARVVALAEHGEHRRWTVTFKEAMVDRARLWAALVPQVAEARLPGPVSEVTVQLTALGPPGGWQGELLAPGQVPRGTGQALAGPEGPHRGRDHRSAGALTSPGAPRWGAAQERLEECLRQLTARYGYCPVGRVVAVEPWNRLPERRLALVTFDL